MTEEVLKAAGDYKIPKCKQPCYLCDMEHEVLCEQRDEPEGCERCRRIATQTYPECELCGKLLPQPLLIPNCGCDPLEPNLDAQKKGEDG